MSIATAWMPSFCAFVSVLSAAASNDTTFAEPAVPGRARTVAGMALFWRAFHGGGGLALPASLLRTKTTVKRWDCPDRVECGHPVRRVAASCREGLSPYGQARSVQERSGTERRSSARTPVLALGPALGSHLCVALSSAQAKLVVLSREVSSNTSCIF